MHMQFLILAVSDTDLLHFVIEAVISLGVAFAIFRLETSKHSQEELEDRVSQSAEKVISTKFEFHEREITAINRRLAAGEGQFKSSNERDQRIEILIKD